LLETRTPRSAIFEFREFAESRRSDELGSADFPKIGGVRKDFFKEPYPASTAFIAPLLNPDWLVEVEAVAVVD
jgi:enamine deaminase RidA (YjgF/YER057c/UK114 family)